jgi:hypothetical protein
MKARGRRARNPGNAVLTRKGKGTELLTDWNRSQFQIVAAIFAGFERTGSTSYSVARANFTKAIFGWQRCLKSSRGDGKLYDPTSGFIPFAAPLSRR